MRHSVYMYCNDINVYILLLQIVIKHVLIRDDISSFAIFLQVKKVKSKEQRALQHRTLQASER